METLTELLQGEGYRVVSAANGNDGLARLQEEDPDLVMTDLMMPIADGRELIRGLRALPNCRPTPVVMMTATTRTVALSDANGTVEVSDFLRKPFQGEKLRDAIVRLIGTGEPAGRGAVRQASLRVATMANLT